MSPAIFLNTNLSEDIIKIIKSYDISPSVFQFEITETTATVYEKELMLWVKNIKNEGAGLCLDDFGSGFANLNVIMKLPFDVIKIDRSMLIDALLDKKSKVLYESIVKMIRHLGFTVVSEGAETEEDIEFLHSINVDCIQGYYYSKPLPPDDFVKLIL
jgi:EAL domain-containing protein (putative c-di-GMP-specific phosphodiesterase class I)